MLEQKKTVWRRLIAFRFLFLINGVILVIIGISFGREFIRNREIQQEISALQEQATALQARNLEIADLNTAFRTESFIEREARLKLGMKKPGEYVVVIQGDTSVQTTGEGETMEKVNDPRTLLVSAEEEKVANPSKWWQYFMH